MLDPVTIFKDGGPFMYLLLLVGMILPPAVLLAGVLQAVRVRVPSVVWSGLAAAPLLLGALGTFMGFGMVLQAVVHASPEMVAKLAANGFSVSLYTLLAGAAMSAFAFGGFSAALGFGALIGVGGERRWNPVGAVALIGLLFAGGLLLFGRFIGAVVTAQASVGLLLAGITDCDEEPHAERLVAAKGAVGWFGVAGVSASVLADVCMMGTLATQAIAMASSEMQGELMAAALEGLWTATGLGLAAAVVLGLVTVVLLGLRMPQATASRTVFGGAIGAIPLVAMLASLAVLYPRGSANLDLLVPTSDKRTPVLIARGVELPTVDLELRKEVLPGRFVTLTYGEATVDDAPASPEAVQHAERVTIEAGADTPIKDLRPWGQALIGAKVDFAVRSRGKLRVIPIPIANGKPPPERHSGREEIPDRFVELMLTDDDGPTDGAGRFEAVWTRSGWVLGRFAGGEREGFGSVGDAELADRLGSLQDLYPDDRDLYVWLPDEARLNDLIVLVATQIERGQATRDQSGLWVTWRVDPAPALPAPAMEPVEDTGDVEGEEDAEGEDGEGEEGAEGEGAEGDDGAEGEEEGDGDGEEDASPTGLVKIGEVKMKGDLARTEMNQVLGQARTRLRRCFSRPGTAVLELTVARTGAVQSSVVGESSGIARVDLCLVRTSQRLRFLPPKTGGVAILTVPLEAL